jgi:methylase of polypeptide subunit release factors
MNFPKTRHAQVFVMATLSDIRVHEVEFCADIKSAADALFAAHPEWPFSHAKIEQRGVGNNKRNDLRIFRKGHKAPLLSGEVKMPGTPEGRSPYNPALMNDAASKADNAGSAYFFTWNVNQFVLFDRSKFNLPIIERRCHDWDLGLQLRRSADCSRPEVMSAITTRFLPELFALLARIVTEDFTEWGMPPDELFIRSLESHLAWPIMGTSDYLEATCRTDKAFSAKLQAWMAGDMSWTFDPDNPDNWRQTLDRAASTLCYVFCNRAIFYEAIRARYPDNLAPLTMPTGKRGHEGIYEWFRIQFLHAVNESGDYEPIFYPDVADKVGSLVFADPMARQGWRGVFENLAHYNFRDIPYDIIGGIFQRLIAPEERQKFGQFFTGEDIVDIINSFCIHRAADKVLDPACGSGSFLIRAYHRKAWLSARRHARQRNADSHLTHQELLADIYGCDIALFAAHLATLNLAARQINDEENYPYIARSNFFEVIENRDAFYRVPAGLRNPDGTRDYKDVPLPNMDAIIGNPPYIRQEAIAKRAGLKRRRDETKAAFESRAKNTKEHFQELVARLWPGLKMSGRSDLHCYFWPVAASLLNDGGYFGFLTSSSWLDVEYGFALQRWCLQNFKVVAIMESLDEPWFPDARVKTAITILQRTDDPAARDSNLVRFVRFSKPVTEVLGERNSTDESARQSAADRLRKLILGTAGPKQNEPLAVHTTAQLRIITLRQSDLWQEGVRAWDILKKGTDATESPLEEDETTEETLEEEAEETASTDDTFTRVLQNPLPTGVARASCPCFMGGTPMPQGGLQAPLTLGAAAPDYAAGKWGRFLRAPDIYFKLIHDYRDRFVRLGEIADVRFGIKSGCDAFFMPRDVTDEILARVEKGVLWNDIGLITHCSRRDVENGKVRIICAGDKTIHPIEAEFIRPEVHSLMEVDRPIVRTADCKRVVLWVNQELKDIADTYAAKYIRWGAKQTFTSKKSKPVKVPERSTCAARERWYDITTDKIGIAFWPKTQQYRHMAPTNPEGIVCNCNLYTVVPTFEDATACTALNAVLNCTIVALLKCFYGRYAGTEGALKTEVVDALMLEIPDPRSASEHVTARMTNALRQMGTRPVTHLVQESMLQCHDETHMREILERPVELSNELRQPDRRALDDAVFEMIEVEDPKERAHLIDELYEQTASYYRQQRTLEIQGMRNRSKAGRKQMSPRDLAASVWDSLKPEERGEPVMEWIKSRWPGGIEVSIPDGKPTARGSDDMFSPASVNFKQGAKAIEMDYASPEHAALVVALAELEIRGSVTLPDTAAACQECREQLAARLEGARARFTELAASRTGQESMREQVVFILLQWLIHGNA